MLLLHFIIIMAADAMPTDPKVIQETESSFLKKIAKSFINFISPSSEESDIVNTEEIDKFLLNIPDTANTEEMIKSLNNYFAYIINEVGIDFENKHNAGARLQVVKLFGMMKRLEQELKKDTQWVRGMMNRPSLKNILIKEIITDPSDLKFQEVRIDSKVVDVFVDDLEKELEEFAQIMGDRGNEVNLEDLMQPKVISKLGDILELDQKSSSNIIGGLVKMLPKEHRKLPVSSDERIEHLRTYLPEILEDPFNPKYLGLTSNKRDEILLQLRNIIDTENKIKGFANLFLAHFYINELGDAGDYTNLYPAITLLEGLRITDDEYDEFVNFEATFDIDLIEMMLQSMIKKHYLNYGDAAVLESKAKGIINKYIAPVINKIKDSKQVITGIRTNAESLILKEVPPSIGVLRGLTGGDCSTSYSWPYPYNYTDHVFYIYRKGEEHNPLGYFSGLFIEVENEKVFYIHTMNGVNISTIQAKLIVNTLSSNPIFVDADRIAISDKVEHLNFIRIKKVFSDAVLTGKSVLPKQVVFYDNQIRRKIENLAKQREYVNEQIGDYDNLDKLKMSVTLLPKDSKILAKSSSLNVEFAEILTEIKENFIPDMSFIDILRSGTISEVLNVVKINKTNLNTLLGIAINFEVFKEGIPLELATASTLELMIELTSIPSKEELAILETANGRNIFFELLRFEKSTRIEELIKLAQGYDYLKERLPLDMLVYSRNYRIKNEDLEILKTEEGRDNFFKALDAVGHTDFSQMLISKAKRLGFLEEREPLYILMTSYAAIKTLNEDDFKILETKDGYDKFIEVLQSGQVSFEDVTKLINMARSFGHLQEGIPLSLLMKSNVMPILNDFAFIRDVNFMVSNLRDLLEEEGIIERRNNYNIFRAFAKFFPNKRGDVLSLIMKYQLAKINGTLNEYTFSKEDFSFLENDKDGLDLKIFIDIFKTGRYLEVATCLINTAKKFGYFKDGVPFQLLINSETVSTEKDFAFLKTEEDINNFYEYLSNISILNGGSDRITKILIDARKFGYLSGPIPISILLKSNIPVVLEDISFIKEKNGKTIFFNSLMQSENKARAAELLITAIDERFIESSQEITTNLLLNLSPLDHPFNIGILEMILARSGGAESLIKHLEVYDNDPVNVFREIAGPNIEIMKKMITDKLKASRKEIFSGYDDCVKWINTVLF